MEDFNARSLCRGGTAWAFVLVAVMVAGCGSTAAPAEPAGENLFLPLADYQAAELAAEFLTDEAAADATHQGQRYRIEGIVAGGIGGEAEVWNAALLMQGDVRRKVQLVCTFTLPEEAMQFQHGDRILMEGIYLSGHRANGILMLMFQDCRLLATADELPQL